MADRSTHFDAPRSPGAFGAAVALLGARWSVWVVLVVPVAIAVFATFGCWLADGVVATMLAEAIDATPFVAVTGDAAVPADAQAVGPRLAALSGVAGVERRDRDEALRRLVAAGLPMPDGRNPLADAWMVRLDSRPTLAGETLGSRVSALRRAIAAIPGVDGTRADDRWIASVDARVTQWRDARTAVGGCVAVGVVLLLAAAGFLAGRGAGPSSNVGWLAVTFMMTVQMAAACAVVAGGIIGAEAAAGSTVFATLDRTTVASTVAAGPAAALVVASMLTVLVVAVHRGMHAQR